MDPITALAAITQLLGVFVQERKGQSDLNRQEFFDWLDNHRHNEIKNLISNTSHLSTEVDEVLCADHEHILAELAQVNGALAQIMSRLSFFGPLATTLAPENTLSNFAMKALDHFETSKEKNMITTPDGSGVQFGNKRVFEHEDPRFLSNDMDALEACGFISMTSRHSSYAVYSITRRGAEYATLLRKQQNELGSPDQLYTAEESKAD